MVNLFHSSSEKCSKLITAAYSTSFYSAINLLHKDLRTPICNIYGFVRLADEIVDSFHDQDKQYLLDKFKKDTFEAIENKLSLNPILNSFQLTVNKYQIRFEYINAFFHSMEMDLRQIEYSNETYNEYIYGSAEVVGLMCLQVFCENNKAQFEQLIPYARALGAAFQKINFLRDVNADYKQLNRTYFPDVNFNSFCENEKSKIEVDILKDFDLAFIGIKNLPLKARFGVYVAYKYYLGLFKKIRNAKAKHILEQRFRIPDYQKFMILAKASIENQLNMI